jgi:Ion channel
MPLTAAIRRIAGCLFFILAIQLPLSFGFNTLRYVWLIGVALTVYWFLGVTVIVAVSRNSGMVDSAYVNQQLLFAVCMSLGLSTFSANNPGLGAFAVGVYSASLYGRWTWRRLLTTRTCLSLLVCLAFTAGLHYWVSKTFSYLGILLAALGLVVGVLVGDVVGIVLNRCVPPLLHVWREIKTVGPVLGGYSLGYVLISIVFAGCYASLARLDSAALKGLDSSGSFIDYWYYSVATLTTIGSDANPVTPIAKALVASEVLCGVGWTVVVFSLVIAAAQRLNQTK